MFERKAEQPDFLPKNSGVKDISKGFGRRH